MFFEDLFTYTVNLSGQTWIPIQHFVRICFDSSLIVSAASVLFMRSVLPMNIMRYIGSCPIFLRNSLSGNKNTVTKKGRSNSSGICRSEATWQVSLCILCQNFPCHSNCVVYSSLDLIGLVHGRKIMPIRIRSFFTRCARRYTYCRHISPLFWLHIARAYLIFSIPSSIMFSMTMQEAKLKSMIPCIFCLSDIQYQKTAIIIICLN